jgi:hypothetical protein
MGNDDQIISMVTPIFAFYILIACNFLGPIFGCRLQHLLIGNMFAKHVIGFVALYFLIVTVSNDLSDNSLLKNLLLSIGVYIWFFITTRAPLNIMIFNIVLLCIIYILHIRYKRSEQLKQSKQSKEGDTGPSGMMATTPPQEGPVLSMGQYNIKMNTHFYVLLLITLNVITSIIGFGLYFREKRAEYKSAFKTSKFLLGTSTCRKYTPKSAIRNVI